MPRIIRCDEERVYYCKKGQIPFKAKVWLYAKVYFEGGYKMGFFEWNGNKYCCPIRILRKNEVQRLQVFRAARRAKDAWWSWLLHVS